MSESITGVVEVVTGPNKGGFYSLKIGDTWYGLGKSRPGFDKGATVSFAFYLKDGKWATVKGDVKLVEQATAASKVSSRTSNGGSRDDYWTEKGKYDREVIEPRITYLAAYERAVHFADIVERAKAIPGLDKAKPESRLEILASFVFELTDDLVARCNATAKTAKKPMKVQAAAPGNDEPEQTEGEEQGENWE